jgi:hypothetical protein
LRRRRRRHGLIQAQMIDDDLRVGIACCQLSGLT